MTLIFIFEIPNKVPKYLPNVVRDLRTMMAKLKRNRYLFV